MPSNGVEEQSHLPIDPVLAEAVTAFRESAQFGIVVDADWRVVFVSDDLGEGLSIDPPLHVPWMGTEWMESMLARSDGLDLMDINRQQPPPWVGMMLTDLGRARVEAQVDPRILEAVEPLEPVEVSSMLSFTFCGRGIGGQELTIVDTAIRIRDELGRLVGTAISEKPKVASGLFSWLVSNSDPDHLARMRRVTAAARRPAALLFADIESSALLARRLSTVSYFSLARRLVRATDDCVIAAGGLVGRHVGDGVAAFFLAEDAGSESAAVRACVTAARAIRSALPEIARRSGLEPDDLVVRIGLHWGASLYVGSIISKGRSEVTALGDEVNNTARIEACATGGRTLASKDLLERLHPDDAAHLDLNTSTRTYTALADLPSATEKARRDAPTLSVSEI